VFISKAADYTDTNNTALHFAPPMNPFHSTLLSEDPLSTASRTPGARSSLRKPVYNPWDQFNKSQFDGFIEDITSALSRALAHEPDPEYRSDSRRSPDAVPYSQFFHTESEDVSASTGGADFGSLNGAVEEDDEMPEDSFVNIKRHPANGKARDPLEGPGLGGLQHEPIELLSDDEGDEGEEPVETDPLKYWLGSDYEGEEGEEGHTVDERFLNDDDGIADQTENAKEVTRTSQDRTVDKEDVLVLSSDDEEVYPHHVAHMEHGGEAEDPAPDTGTPTPVPISFHLRPATFSDSDKPVQFYDEELQSLDDGTPCVLHVPLSHLNMLPSRPTSAR
jgi:hypothetical protein